MGVTGLVLMGAAGALLVGYLLWIRGLLRRGESRRERVLSILDRVFLVLALAFLLAVLAVDEARPALKDLLLVWLYALLGAGIVSALAAAELRRSSAKEDGEGDAGGDGPADAS